MNNDLRQEQANEKEGTKKNEEIKNKETEKQTDR